MSTETGSRLTDRPDSFGWVSIALHWITTAVVIALWLIGRSITEQPSVEAVDARRDLHVTIALWAWALLLFRIYWRVRMKHPHASGQSLLIHRVAATTHYAMLLVVSLMLISGPIMVFIDNPAIRSAALSVHATCGSILLILVLLHIGGTLKHIIFHDDDTIVRMLWPKSE